MLGGERGSGADGMEGLFVMQRSMAGAFGLDQFGWPDAFLGIAKRPSKGLALPPSVVGAWCGARLAANRAKPAHCVIPYEDSGSFFLSYATKLYPCTSHLVAMGRAAVWLGGAYTE